MFSIIIKSFMVDFPFVPIMAVMFRYCTYPAIILGRYNSVIATGIRRALADFPATTLFIRKNKNIMKTTLLYIYMDPI